MGDVLALVDQCSTLDPDDARPSAAPGKDGEAGKAGKDGIPGEPGAAGEST